MLGPLLYKCRQNFPQTGMPIPLHPTPSQSHPRAPAGPTFELSDYLRFIEKEGMWSPRAQRRMPSPVLPGLLRFGKALACMALHLWLVKHFSADVYETAWFYSLSLPARCDPPKTPLPPP